MRRYKQRKVEISSILITHDQDLLLKIRILSVLYSQLISNLSQRPNVYKDLRSVSNTFICLDVLEEL